MHVCSHAHSNAHAHAHTHAHTHTRTHTHTHAHTHTHTHTHTHMRTHTRTHTHTTTPPTYTGSTGAKTIHCHIQNTKHCNTQTSVGHIQHNWANTHLHMQLLQQHLFYDGPPRTTSILATRSRQPPCPCSTRRRRRTKPGMSTNSKRGATDGDLSMRQRTPKMTLVHSCLSLHLSRRCECVVSGESCA